MIKMAILNHEETHMARKVCLLFCFVVLVFVMSPGIFAKQKEDKFEVAGHFSLLLDRDKVADAKMVLPGFGGTLTYFPSKYLGLEAEYSFHVERNFLQPVPDTFIGEASARGLYEANYNGPAHMSLFGIRTGMRTDIIGLFVKVRPGFAVFHPVYDCDPIAGVWPADLTNQFGETHKKEFAMDYGAVIEGYLPHHTFVRLDAGDTYLQFGKTDMIFSGSGVRYINYQSGEDNRHHFHFRIGFGIGF